MMISNCYQIMIQFVYKACNAQALIIDDNQDYSNSYDSNTNIVQTQQPTDTLSSEGTTDSEKSIDSGGAECLKYPYDQINLLKINSSDSSDSGTNSTIVSTNSTSSNHILSNSSNEFNESDNKQLLKVYLKSLGFEEYFGLIDQHWTQLQPFFALNFLLYQNFFEQYFFDFHDKKCRLEDFNIKSIEKVLKKIEDQSKKQDLTESLNLSKFYDDLPELADWGLFCDFEHDEN